MGKSIFTQQPTPAGQGYFDVATSRVHDLFTGFRQSLIAAEYGQRALRVLQDTVSFWGTPGDERIRQAIRLLAGDKGANPTFGVGSKKSGAEQQQRPGTRQLMALSTLESLRDELGTETPDAVLQAIDFISGKYDEEDLRQAFQLRLDAVHNLGEAYANAFRAVRALVASSDLRIAAAREPDNARAAFDPRHPESGASRIHANPAVIAVKHAEQRLEQAYRTAAHEMPGQAERARLRSISGEFADLLCEMVSEYPASDADGNRFWMVNLAAIANIPFHEHRGLVSHLDPAASRGAAEHASDSIAMIKETLLQGVSGVRADAERITAAYSHMPEHAQALRAALSTYLESAGDLLDSALVRARDPELCPHEKAEALLRTLFDDKGLPEGMRLIDVNRECLPLNARDDVPECLLALRGAQERMLQAVSAMADEARQNEGGAHGWDSARIARNASELVRQAIRSVESGYGLGRIDGMERYPAFAANVTSNPLEAIAERLGGEMSIDWLNRTLGDVGRRREAPAAL